MKSILVVMFSPYFRPGLKRSSLPPAIAAASPMIAERLKPYIVNTQMVMMKAPAMSRQALMICTQVVPFMPPMNT